MNIVYLETVLVFASNSNDADICKTIIEWAVQHNISKRDLKFVNSHAKIFIRMRE